MGGRAAVQPPETEAEKGIRLAKEQEQEDINIYKRAVTAGITSESIKKQQATRRNLAQQAYDVMIAKYSKPDTLQFGNKNKALFEQTADSVNVELEKAKEVYKKEWGKDIFDAISTGSALPTSGVTAKKAAKPSLWQQGARFDPVTGLPIQPLSPQQQRELNRQGPNRQSGRYIRPTTPSFDPYTGMRL